MFIVVIIRDNCIAIALNHKAIPVTHEFTQPMYSITIVAIECQHMPAPRLTITDNSEIWTKDGDDGIRNLVVGRCQGRVGGYFLFTCWGCDGARSGAYEHKRCAYGVIRVDEDALHPTFDQADFPEISSVSRVLDDCWRNIHPDHHLRLALVYPPGYASQTTTWYEYKFPIAVFTTETETQCIARDIDDTDQDDEYMMNILEQESRLDRDIARQTIAYARNIAELCKSVNSIRTYRKMLATCGRA